MAAPQPPPQPEPSFGRRQVRPLSSGLAAARRAAARRGSAAFYGRRRERAPQSRPRPRSIERPVNGRLYRGTWLVVAFPLLIAALTVSRTRPLPTPSFPPAFDAQGAHELALSLATQYPDRFPGTPTARAAAAWVAAQLRAAGLRVESQRFSLVIPGYGRRELENVSADLPGPPGAQTILVAAHRDDPGTAAGANDNASGTAALIQLARAFVQVPNRVHTLRFLSSDGGSFGGLGVAHLLEDTTGHGDVVAALNLDALAGRGGARVEIAGDRPRSPSPTLVSTASTRLLDETGAQPGHASGAAQLIDLALPFSLYEQAPFVARGIPALTITTAGARPPAAEKDSTRRLNRVRFAELGRAANALLASLDQGLELVQGTSSYVYVGSRVVRGWAIELVLIAALLPFLIAAVDLFARCRRRRIDLAPALRSLRSRIALWLWVGALFLILARLGAWPHGPPRPLAPASAAGGEWSIAGVAVLVVGGLAGWLFARERLIPRRGILAAEELAGHTVALLALGVVALLVTATNPFALVFVLPSLHAWLWLAQLRRAPPAVRGLALLAGFLGPAFLFLSFSSRFGLGFDTPWYLLSLVALGYIPPPLPIIGLGWLAVAGQMAALAAGRYAPYPTAAERRPRPPLRELIRRTALAVRSYRSSKAAPARDEEAEEA